ncbi:MAG: hypothetical protein IPH31_04830 [Lewinellaceae bacterium]|nr:hypothetical protein [Lewinellaceae bacterium]
MENDFVSANNNMAGIAEKLAQYEMYYGDATLINTELERYRKVTRESLSSGCQQVLQQKCPVEQHWMPQPAKP